MRPSGRRPEGPAAVVGLAERRRPGARGRMVGPAVGRGTRSPWRRGGARAAEGPGPGHGPAVAMETRSRQALRRKGGGGGGDAPARDSRTCDHITCSPPPGPARAQRPPAVGLPRAAGRAGDVTVRQPIGGGGAGSTAAAVPVRVPLLAPAPAMAQRGGSAALPDNPFQVRPVRAGAASAPVVPFPVSHGVSRRIPDRNTRRWTTTTPSAAVR